MKKYKKDILIIAVTFLAMLFCLMWIVAEGFAM
jgi:hypothetical protein